MTPRLSLAQQILHRELLELVRQHEHVVPGARSRVTVKESPTGEVVIAIVVSAPRDRR